MPEVSFQIKKERKEEKKEEIQIVNSEKTQEPWPPLSFVKQRQW